MEHSFSRIIQGCMTWGQWGKQLSTEEQVARIDHCVSQGITTFDHADIYGDYTTEEEFGHAFAKASISRDQIQLITKCGIQYQGENRPENTIKHYQYDKAYVVGAAERALRLLQTDYIDLFLLHRPSPLMHPDEIAEAADQLQTQGKIKAFGVSNFTPSQTELIRSKTPVYGNQIECSLTATQSLFDGQLDYMMTHSIMPMAWSPLGAVFQEENPQTQRLHEKLETLASKYQVSKDQLLLAWILKHPARIHPVIGTTQPERIAAAVQAQHLELELQDWFELLVASQGHKVP
ncbi:aldo/keto reductase [Croceiramulus getboli]|nr:aldo/keto reductase [Flavobacteriaceae bacterium YJPT1-3]